MTLAPQPPGVRVRARVRIRIRVKFRVRVTVRVRELGVRVLGVRPSNSL